MGSGDGVGSKGSHGESTGGGSLIGAGCGVDDGCGCLEGDGVVVGSGVVDFDAEGRAGGDEVAVPEGADFAEDPSGWMVGIGVAEFSGSLDHGFEHEDAGEDVEGREMVLEVFLGEADVLDGHDALGGLLEDSIDEVEVHGETIWRIGSRRGIFSGRCDLRAALGLV